MHALLAKAKSLTGLIDLNLTGLSEHKMTAELSFKDVKKTVFKIPLHQMLVGVAVALVFYFVSGKSAAGAAMFGAFISTMGSLAFALKVFLSPVRDEREIKSRMVKGEAYKMFTVAVLFYVAIAVLKLTILPLLLGFIATFVTFWVALLTAFK